MKFLKLTLIALLVAHNAFADDPTVFENSNSPWGSGMGFPGTTGNMGMGFPGGADGSTGMGMGFGGQPPKAPATITVKFSDSTAVQTCNLDSLSSTYICPNSGQPILVKNSYMGFKALGRDKNGPTNIVIKKVEAEGKTVFEDKYEQTEQDLKKRPEQLSNRYFNNVTVVETFFEGNKKVSGSDEYKKIASGFIAEKDFLKEKFHSVFQENRYQVELGNGQKISCQRGGTRALSEQEIAHEKLYQQKIMCSAFQCDEVTVNGKKYRATMLYDSNPSPYMFSRVHLIDDNGIGPRIDINKITSPSSKLPLEDASTREINKDNPFKDYFIKELGRMIPQSIPERDKVIDYKSPGFDELIQVNKNICGQDNKALKDLEEAKKKLLQNLADAKLAEFIQVLADGRLTGLYIDPNKAASMGCNYEGVYLDPEAAKHLDHLKKNIHPDKSVSEPITMDRANQLFKKAVNMKDIAWKYKPDGCYARAHLMARRFEAEGVRVDKVWIKGDLSVPGTNIRWNFHVAPIVYVNNDKGQIQKMVIDPSLFDKPVTVEEWDNRMSKNTVRGSSITAFPFPENAAMMERSALAFSSSDPYLPGDNIHMTEASKMLQADQTMKQYKQMEPK